MKTAKYNFRRKENKEKAVYKLVIYLKPNSGIKSSYTNSNGNKVSVYYGYYKKQDFGLQMLRSIAQANKDKIKYGHDICKTQPKSESPGFFRSG